MMALIGLLDALVRKAFPQQHEPEWLCSQCGKDFHAFGHPHCNYREPVRGKGKK
jgi:hypothetical protein